MCDQAGEGHGVGGVGAKPTSIRPCSPWRRPWKSTMLLGPGYPPLVGRLLPGQLEHARGDLGPRAGVDTASASASSKK